MTAVDAAEPMRVAELHRYPVKSLQGVGVDQIEIGTDGFAGDRRRALLDRESGALLTAKRYGRMLEARADETAITLPDGIVVAVDDPGADGVLSAWLGRDVRLAETGPAVAVAYEMTFDPPDDAAEYYAIDAPSGSFLDLAPVHLVTRQTLEWCARQRPDLDWDVRRFRPNLVLDAPGLVAFAEDRWSGRQLRVGSALLEVMQPTVRCAMPLRPQPGLSSQPEMYAALEELHANHLGLYLSVLEAGTVTVGDAVALV